MAELMTLEEVAHYLRVTEKTVYRLLTRGDIPATKVGHQWRFDKVAIDAWLQKNSISAKATILVIDDEETIRSLFKDTLEELGHRVFLARNAIEGLSLMGREDFDLVFLDLKLPGIDGAEVHHMIKTIKPGLPVIIITGYPDSDIMTRALLEGPFGVMNKPFTESDIIAGVKMFLRTVKTNTV